MTASEEAAFAHYREAVKACYCKRCPAYRTVGARGIGMCKPWRHSFKNFIADMGVPEQGQQLLRRDLQKAFNKDNCLWG
jgi:hypothetical protein